MALQRRYSVGGKVAHFTAPWAPEQGLCGRWAPSGEVGDPMLDRLPTCTHCAKRRSSRQFWEGRQRERLLAMRDHATGDARAEFERILEALPDLHENQLSAWIGFAQYEDGWW